MQDPIQRHPTRAEQLDILAELVAAVAPTDGRVLDLGCGTGYVAHLLLQRRPDLRVMGVDRKAESLAEARTNLTAAGDRLALVPGDLSAPDGLPVPQHAFPVVLSCLTLHDLTDEGKAQLIGWAAERLTTDGVLLLYDRLRLTSAALFPLQRALWRRLERLHGAGMRAADDFAGYVADLGEANRPATLDQYSGWFAEAGLEMQIVHLHGNIALLAGARPVGAHPDSAGPR